VILTSEFRVRQALGYMFAKYAAEFTLSPEAKLLMFKSAIKKLDPW